MKKYLPQILTLIAVIIFLGGMQKFFAPEAVDVSYAPAAYEEIAPLETSQEALGAPRTAGAKEVGTYKSLNLFVATTTSATSTDMNIAGASKVTLAFARGAHSSGSSVFSIMVSIDGVDYIPYNKLIDNVANTNAQTITRVASKTLSANGTSTVALDLASESYISMRCVVVETTDGSHTCKALIDY